MPFLWDKVAYYAFTLGQVVFLQTEFASMGSFVEVALATESVQVQTEAHFPHSGLLKKVSLKKIPGTRPHICIIVAHFRLEIYCKTGTFAKIVLAHHRHTPSSTHQKAHHQAHH